MTTYPLAKAEENLSRLIDEALAGEAVTISRHGQDVVELRPVRVTLRQGPTRELLDKITQFARSLPRSQRDTSDLVREMRDEE